ncbi:ribosomal protein L14E (/ type) [Desulforamulus profundi]|uniref:Ribosomal protein L14E (/ type) n=1 Tax=Desulforamulus profundi TaxID=1383067 RepID=A0A2C6MD71_9FIRM|nr:KOW domain-containing RNA-binding protein [Desulforamulus profundi]MCL5781134.1 KOW domain-containing RNA-binding protein [Bacillota bacterium]PHJ37216.1 ribosomal protein L14E (/ type) [Desulforamulus profundi]
MVDQVRPGQLVSSTQGRDAGRYYLVLHQSDNGFVVVTDGEYRGTEKPKKKNPKHLKVWPLVSENIGVKLAAQSKVTNAEVMSELAELMRKLQEEPLLKGKEVG